MACDWIQQIKTVTLYLFGLVSLVYTGCKR